MIDKISILKGITILYVEDESSVREITVNVLKSFTKKQILAVNGLEGLDLFKKHQDKIDLVITDINMPKMNGLEMIKEIKKINTNIPIIVATAFSNTEYLLEAIDIGVDKYVLKPVNMEKLLQMMSQSLLYHEIKELYIDKLTRLSNRNQLKKDLEVTSNSLLALVDIDKFSTINDIYGEDNGNKVLSSMSDRIKKYYDEDLFKLYKIESDKFVIIAQNQSVSIEEFEIICSKFINYIEITPLTIEENEIDIRITIGIAQSISTDTYKFAQRAVRYARIKIESLLIYDDSLNIENNFKENIMWAKKIKLGIKNNLFSAYFQPIVNTNTQEILKYEALIRYMENGVPIPPIKFLDISKKIKLYYKIIEIMLLESINLIREKNKRVSVNISFQDISNNTTRKHIIDTLEKNQQYTHMLEFEILESEEIVDLNEVSTFIEDVKKYGCKVGIDDFGAGYSNFHMLSNLDLDFIKIDGSLIKDIDKLYSQEVIVSTIANIAKQFGFKTVAEFVSSKDIYEKIKEIGVDYSQGYYFSRPISFKEV